MTEQAFQKRFAELVARINDLPEDQREHLEKLASETRQRHYDLKRNCKTMRDHLVRDD
jgi:hypothetical protein